MYDFTQDSLETIELLFSQAPQGVVALEAEDLRIRWMNASCGEFLNGSPDTFHGRLLPEVVPEHELLPILQEVQRSGEAQAFRQKRTKSIYTGHRWLTGVATKLGGLVVLQLDDVTPTIKALEEGFLGEQLLEQIPFPTALLSERGEVLRLNPRAHTRFSLQVGMGGDEVIGAMRLVISRGNMESTKSLLRARLLNREVIELRGSYWDRLLGEQRDCLIYGGPVRNLGRVHAFLLTLIDVTDLRRAERAKDEFINNAGHELRTPLTAARSNLELALRYELAGPQARLRVENAVRATRRMARLIDDILETERLETGRLELKLERRDIAKTVRETVERIRSELGDGFRFELQIDGPLPVEHDPLRIDQVLENIISNAARSSPKGSTIQVIAKEEKGCAMIEVSDEGCGIPEAELPWVFDRLYRGRKSEGDGLGLGLFIAQQLVVLHGGTIGAENRQPRGSSFFLFIPLATPEGPYFGSS